MGDLDASGVCSGSQAAVEVRTARVRSTADSRHHNSFSLIQLRAISGRQSAPWMISDFPRKSSVVPECPVPNYACGRISEPWDFQPIDRQPGALPGSSLSWTFLTWSRARISGARYSISGSRISDRRIASCTSSCKDPKSC